MSETFNEYIIKLNELKNKNKIKLQELINKLNQCEILENKVNQDIKFAFKIGRAHV